MFFRLLETDCLAGDHAHFYHNFEQGDQKPAEKGLIGENDHGDDVHSDSGCDEEVELNKVGATEGSRLRKGCLDPRRMKPSPNTQL